MINNFLVTNSEGVGFLFDAIVITAFQDHQFDQVFEIKAEGLKMFIEII